MMIKKLLLSFIALCLCIGQLYAATEPIVSTNNTTVWYVVQFLNGGNALTAQGDGAKVLTGVPTGKTSQLWKVEGSSVTGYKLVSKNGLTLYTSSTVKDGMFYAASTPSNSNTLFKLVASTNATYRGEWILSPKANTSVFMNQWGGASSGAQLGLWNNASDENQPFKFVSEEEFLATGKSLPIIPYPASLTRKEGALNVNSITTITYADTVSRPLAEAFAQQFNSATGRNLNIQQSTNALNGAISLLPDETKGEDAYGLVVNGNGVVITASKYGGYFYAIQTLRQLLPVAIYGIKQVDASKWALPYVDIADKPQYEYRGFHFDVSRHFFSVDEVKKLLDAAATYKLNRFHWHLTDDQGWRIEIPEWPKLTEIGAVRSSSYTLLNSGGQGKFYDDTEYGRGCFYTLDDLADVVSYAKKLNIEIIPEIDLPGHMVAVLASYPELSCDSTKQYKVRVDNGVSRDVLNVGNDKVIDFLKCVLGHVATVFPYNYVHLGGDECPTDNWTSNAECLKRVKDKGLTGVNQLQSWLIEELGTWLKSNYNKDIIAWDEVIDPNKSHWIETNTVKPVIMAWTGMDLSKQAADKGLRSISMYYNNMYLDLMPVPPSQELVEEPYFGGYGDGYYNTVNEIYNYNPVANMSGREDYIMGTQVNLWTETVPTNESAEYCFFPRIMALSEAAWLPQSKKNWVNFYQRLQDNVKILDVKGVTYAKHCIEKPEQTASEAALSEAKTLLDNSIAGKVGYPSASDYNQLETAYNNATIDETKISALQTAIAAYKQAPLTLPQAGKTYSIRSAATATRVRYDGSSVYMKDNNLAMHYTPQSEAEELWYFTPQTDGSFIISLSSNGKQVTMPQYDASLTLTDKGTSVNIGIPTANGSYTYTPGVVTFSSSADETAKVSNVRRFYGMNSGLIVASNNTQLCMPGTWRIEEVVDYKAYLESLCKKCERIIETATPGKMGEPTQDALNFLQEQVVTPAKKETTVDKTIYEKYSALYMQFLAIPRPSVLDVINEEHYYRIRNAYFPTLYAYANKSSKKIQPKSLGTSDNYLWSFKKKGNGTASITSKATATSVYVPSNKKEQDLMLGSDYAWTLQEVNTDQSNSGIAIIDGSGTYSWYTNKAFSNILLEPYNWGASIWSLEETTISVPTAIQSVIASHEEIEKFYDLSGRSIVNPTNGVYVSNKHNKILK